MKMTLDQLRVDSYATKVNENELTEIKGGSTWICDAVWWLTGGDVTGDSEDFDDEYELEHGHDLEDAGELCGTSMCNL